jgi:hypothetical protein
MPVVFQVFYDVPTWVPFDVEPIDDEEIMSDDESKSQETPQAAQANTTSEDAGGFAGRSVPFWNLVGIW